MKFPGNPCLITTRTNVDHTESMQQWARRRVQELEKEVLCGYVALNDRMRVYRDENTRKRGRIGILVLKPKAFENF